MKFISFSISTLLVLVSLTHLNAQSIAFTKDNLKPIGVRMSFEKMNNRQVVLLEKDSAIKEIDEATFAKVTGVEFTDGVIEVEILSKLSPKASESARGFIGIAFRISEDNSKFECIYIRPTNGRAEDQVRRNHSIQYFAFPEFKFPRLRKESPEKYESYADMGLNEWIKLKIVVKGAQAKLFLNKDTHPSLIVNDLKLGANASGSVGLFVDVGTEGRFANLKVSQ